MSEKKRDELDIQSTDIVVSIVKAFVSQAPIIGPAVAEFIEYAMPRQRMDRIADTLRRVDEDANNPKKIIEKMKTPEGRDLLEDAIVQASRALTEDRRQYIANLFRNSLTKEEVLHDQNKKLFKILDELNDSEIILLKYYSMSLGRDMNHPFLKKHWEVLGPIERELASQKTEPRSIAFIYNYMNTLDRLGLVTMQTELIKNRKPIGTSELGRLLLDYIEVSE